MVRIRKAKGQQWRKGHSCESNPKMNKHRIKMRKGIITGQNVGSTSNLTTRALEKHNEIQDSSIDHEGDDVMSTKSAGLFSIGGLTDCSNPVFDNVKRFWNSQASYQKEVCAVLAAVTEVIKAQGGKETETEYFAALMTALESDENEESLTAIAYLLTLVIKSVPESILKAKFSKAAKILLTVLGGYAGDGGTSLLRSLLVCLSKVLSVQDEVVWSESSTMKTYHGLLSFTIHSKPKVRKCAHEAVEMLLKKPRSDSEFHPAASATVKFCIQQIQEHGGSSQSISTLHIIGLLKDILPLLPVQNVKAVCETLLKLMTLGDVMVTVNALQAMFKLFSESTSTATLSVELNAQIINALYDYQPSIRDMDLSQAWMSTLEKAYINLARIDPKLCTAHLPRCFSSLMPFYLSEHKSLAVTVANTMKELLKSCIQPAVEIISEELSKSGNNSNTAAHKIVRCLEAGLKYRYHQQWGLILQVIGVLFEVLGKPCSDLLKKMLVSLCDLYGTHKFPYSSDLKKAVGMAIQKMGPKKVLDAVPLALDKPAENYEFPRAWLLPVLKDNIKDTELKYFFNVMLPLAAELRTISTTLKEAGKELESKVYDTLQFQIWSLLPGFCTRPTDICQSFKSVARILGVALTERPDLCLTVCHGLRLLVSKTTKEEEKKELSVYAKNYLPILFNLYSGEEKEGEPDKLPILETIRTYLTITDTQLASKFLSKAIEKVTNKETSVYSRNHLMDLIIAMIPYVEQSVIEKLYNIVVPYLKVQDVSQQKKAYRVLEQICASSSPACTNFVSSHLKDLQEILMDTLSASSSASKAPRLRCLCHIVHKLDADQEDFIRAIVPEVILCTKEVSVKARTAALTLLVAACHALCRCQGMTRRDGLISYLELVMAGLAGSPHMVSATIISISRIVYEFRADVPTEVMEQLIRSVLVCLASKSKEIIKSTLGFFKVVISVLSREDLAPYAQDMASGVVTWNEDNRRRFRYNVKVLFERLIRKFGYQTTLKCVPEKHRKLVQNIHKTTQRLKRQKIAARAKNMADETENKDILTQQEESYEALMFGSDDEEDEPKHKAKSKNKKLAKGNVKGPKTWIREGADEEPVDFMDSKIVQRVVATDPSKGAKRKHDDDFEISKDGKLIIPDDNAEDDGETGTKRKRKRALETPHEEEDLEYQLKELGSKGKKFRAEDEDDDESERQGAPRSGNSFGSEYKAKRAGGDVKRKGKPDPYAYLPLNRSSLNKRKQRKAAGQFQSLVRATKKGSSKVKGHRQGKSK